MIVRKRYLFCAVLVHVSHAVMLLQSDTIEVVNRICSCAFVEKVPPMRFVVDRHEEDELSCALYWVLCG